MTYRLIASLIASLALFLAGCGDKPGATAAAKATSTPVSIEAISSQAEGFTAGSSVSARTVYVFFDPQCPHCNELWEAARPLKAQARFVWIPVGILNASSTSQGAALLSAPDPVAAMDAHEQSMRARQGGITAAGDLPKRAVVLKNTTLLNSFGFSSIPTIVAKHAQTGELVTREGAMPTAALATFLGLQVPAEGVAPTQAAPAAPAK
ncbi:MAG: DsbC family protein [Pseudomonadota bacterium]